MAEAFVYCWTDMKTSKLYVGWHKGSVDDGYVCSSKPMLEEYYMRPNDFKRQIIASGLSNDMIALESAILKTEKVLSRTIFCLLSAFLLWSSPKLSVLSTSIAWPGNTCSGKKM